MIHPGHNYPENIFEPDLLDDAVGLFKRAMEKEKPDNHYDDLEGVKEYQCPGTSKRTNQPRRLKLLIK